MCLERGRDWALPCECQVHISPFAAWVNTLPSELLDAVSAKQKALSVT